MYPDTQQPLFLGRQPILDRERRLCAYELLFRSDASGAAHVTDGAQATATVMVNAFAELGMTHVLDDCDAYINVDQGFLFSDLIELLPRPGAVIEILESVPPTPAVVERCRALRALGYTLALDDVVAMDARTVALLPLVRVVKVDVMAVNGPPLARLVADLRRQAPHVRLLAEKVETQADYDHCMALGFALFQGYHFARPSTLVGRRLGHSQRTLLRLMTQLCTDASSRDLEETLKTEPGLTVNLLRMANSAGSSASTTVTSLGDVIHVLGRRYLQRWVQLLLFCSGGNGAHLDPLLMLAATRGRLMEITVNLHRPRDAAMADGAFMAGMMSLMPALLGMPMEQVLPTLGLAPAIDTALRRRDGPIGHLLRLATASEEEGVPDLGAALLANDWVCPVLFSRAQSEALAWAHSLSRRALGGNLQT